MFSSNQRNNISLIKGDYHKFRIEVADENNLPVDLSIATSMNFTIKEDLRDLNEEATIIAYSQNDIDELDQGIVYFEILPEHTENKKPKTYYFDITINLSLIQKYTLMRGECYINFDVNN